MMIDKQLSDNFWLSEFNFVAPEPDLLKVLQYVRDYIGPVNITSSTRTVEQHIKIYKDLYKDEWLDKIPWKSRHLPEFERGLRAVDITVKDKIGLEIAQVCEVAAKKYDVLLGLGTGIRFVHLDVDRTRQARWTYKY